MGLAGIGSRIGTPSRWSVWSVPNHSTPAEPKAKVGRARRPSRDEVSCARLLAAGCRQASRPLESASSPAHLQTSSDEGANPDC